MIWALPAFLRIPLRFSALILFAAFMQRRSVQQTDGVFRYKVRGDNGWSRGKRVANWMSDVLVNHRGIALLRSDANQVKAVDVVGPPEESVKGLGQDVVEVSFAFADGKYVGGAVAESALSTAMSPFTPASSS